MMMSKRNVKRLGTRMGDCVILLIFLIGVYFLVKDHCPVWYLFVYYFLFKVWDGVNRIGDLIEYREDKER